MSIHLRSVNDEIGDVVDLLWYCDRGCYSASFADLPASESVEEGGAYPCGSESDSPDFCARCERPVGNALTSEGEQWVTETIAEGGEFADALLSTYPECAPLEPDEDDAFISPSGYLGTLTSASIGGKFIGEFASDDEALAAIGRAMERDQFYPNVWRVSDHGNVSLVEDVERIL